MTKFQALFVLYLRHESLMDCSWRALAGNYYSRYSKDGELIPYKDRVEYDGNGGNQIDGMDLEAEASKILRPRVRIGPRDLYECNLAWVDANLSRHLQKSQYNNNQIGNQTKK